MSEDIYVFIYMCVFIYICIHTLYINDIYLYIHKVNEY